MGRALALAPSQRSESPQAPNPRRAPSMLVFDQLTRCVSAAGDLSTSARPSGGGFIVQPSGAGSGSDAARSLLRLLPVEICSCVGPERVFAERCFVVVLSHSHASGTIYSSGTSYSRTLPARSGQSEANHDQRPPLDRRHLPRLRSRLLQPRPRLTPNPLSDPQSESRPGPFRGKEEGAAWGARCRRRRAASEPGTP